MYKFTYTYKVYYIEISCFTKYNTDSAVIQCSILFIIGSHASTKYSTNSAEMRLISIYVFTQFYSVAIFD
jgi:hypothetical protein